MILVTGSAGLVGRHLCANLLGRGFAVRTFDIKHAPAEDVTCNRAVDGAVQEVSGIIHLAAVSRVIDGERNPDACQKTNIGGLTTLISASLRAPRKPWFIFVSSREVYGNAAVTPASEDSPLEALNTYAHTKVAGEKLVAAAREAGLLANICRLSTVYGDLKDHADRVLPAFCRAAAAGARIRVQGADVVLDPTHISDVVNGLCRLVALTSRGEKLPPIHFVSGRGASLLELAQCAIAAGNRKTELAIEEPRAFDVSRFIGDPKRAERLLGWTAKTTLEEGVERFVQEFREARLKPADMAAE